MYVRFHITHAPHNVHIHLFVCSISIASIMFDDVAYYSPFNTLKLIKPKSKTLQPLTFVDGSALVSIFIYTARKLTIVSRANVIKDLFTKFARSLQLLYPLSLVVSLFSTSKSSERVDESVSTSFWGKFIDFFLQSLSLFSSKTKNNSTSISAI